MAHEWEILIIVINGLSFLIFGIGAWWFKTMGDDIKKLRDNHSSLELIVMELKTKEEGREKLQNERWANLSRDMGLLLNRKHNGGNQSENQPQAT